MGYQPSQKRLSESHAAAMLLSSDRWIVLGILSLLFILPIALQGYGHDFCPIYEGARLMVNDQSPYGAAATAYLAQTCPAVEAGAGTAYPLPFYFLLVPFVLLPFPIAAFIWTWIGTLLSLAIFLFVRQWPNIIFLSICFLPFYRAVMIGQSSLIWFGICVILLMSLCRNWWFMAGICIAILVWKPQAGAIFALAGMWWGIRYDRRVLLVGAVHVWIMLIVAYVWQPNWLADWLLQVAVYQRVNISSSWLIILPLALVLSWRFPGIVKIALIQVFLFPLVDPYAALPLLIIWILVGGWGAFFGASVAYLWPSWPWQGHWLLIIGPLLLAMAYRSWTNGATIGGETLLFIPTPRSDTTHLVHGKRDCTE